METNSYNTSTCKICERDLKLIKLNGNLSESLTHEGFFFDINYENVKLCTRKCLYEQIKRWWQKVSKYFTNPAFFIRSETELCTNLTFKIMKEKKFEIQISIIKNSHFLPNQFCKLVLDDPDLVLYESLKLVFDDYILNDCDINCLKDINVYPILVTWQKVL